MVSHQIEVNKHYAKKPTRSEKQEFTYFQLKAFLDTERMLYFDVFQYVLFVSARVLTSCSSIYYALTGTVQAGIGLWAGHGPWAGRMCGRPSGGYEGDLSYRAW